MNKTLVVLLGLVALGVAGTAKAGDLPAYDRVNIGSGNVLGAGATWGNVFGKQNTNNAVQSTIAGGTTNRIDGDETTNSFIGGGVLNHIGTYNSSIVAGGYNSILEDAYNSCIGGGVLNVISNKAAYCTIGGGFGNIIGSNNSVCVIGAGQQNTIYDRAWYSTIGGGIANQIRGNLPSASVNCYATIAGGYGNVIWTNNWFATISGGGANQIKNTSGASTIGGGVGNIIDTNCESAVIAGGEANTINPSASFGAIGGGHGNWVGGYGATVPGGDGNIATGSYSCAAGQGANAVHNGSFVWGDSAPHNVYSSAADQFVVRAAGGFWFGNSSGTISIPSGHFIETTANGGAYLGTDGNWHNPSDRNIKTNIDPIKATEVLGKVAELPVSSWSYKVEDPSVRHIGPMAQDFYAAFRLGKDDRFISALDETGVALAAIQGLNQIEKEQESEISALRGEVAELRKKAIAQQEAMRRWENRLAAIEKSDDVAGEVSFARSDR